MTINYTKGNEMISVEINSEEFEKVFAIIGAKLIAGKFFDGEPPKEEPQKPVRKKRTVKKDERLMNNLIREDYLIACRSIKSSIFPDKYCYIKQYLRNNKIEAISDKTSAGDETVKYWLTDIQLVDLMKFLEDNGCGTYCAI